MASREIVLTRVGQALSALESHFNIARSVDTQHRILVVLERCSEVLLGKYAPNVNAEMMAITYLAMSDVEKIGPMLGMKKESAEKVVRLASEKAGAKPAA